MEVSERALAVPTKDTEQARHWSQRVSCGRAPP